MELTSLLADWSSGRGPLHRKLTHALGHAIDVGSLAVGSRLPSERELAQSLVVSRGTVVAAYDALRAQGAIEGRQGSGTYVLARHQRERPDPVASGPAAPIFDRLISGVTGDDPVISFACATVPASRALRDALRAWDPDSIEGMLSGPGYLPLGLPALRAAVARRLSADGLPTQAEQVLITTGAQQAIALCASTLVRRGDVVVVESPTFPGCADAFRSAGARFVTLPIDGDGVKVDHLAAILARQPVAAIYLMPTFHNPTGAVLTEERRKRLCDLAATAGVPIVEDNALAHTSLRRDGPPPPLASFQNSSQAPVLTVGSVSKSIWGGLRIGWLRAPEPWLGRLARRKAAADLGSGVIGQGIAATLIDMLPEIREANREMLTDRLGFCTGLLREHLPDWRWSTPAGGPSLWVRLPAGNSDQFAQVALRHGVEVIPGSAFATDGTQNDHFRLPFTFDAEVMEEAVSRLTSAWNAYVPESVRRGGSSPLGIVV